MNHLTLQESRVYLLPTAWVYIDVCCKEAHVWSVSPQAVWSSLLPGAWNSACGVCWPLPADKLVICALWHDTTTIPRTRWIAWPGTGDITETLSVILAKGNVPSLGMSQCRALIYDCAIPPIAHKARLHVECIIIKQDVILALATWQCIIFSTLCPIPTERNVEFPAVWSACGCNTLSSLISKSHNIKGQTVLF